MPTPLEFDGHVVRVGGQPWFDIGSQLPAGVNADVVVAEAGITFTLTAERDLAGFATGSLNEQVVNEPSVTEPSVTEPSVSEPTVIWPLILPRVEPLTAAGVKAFGYQMMEFALPSVTGPDAHGLAPWPIRPAAAMPIIWAGPETPAVLIGPANAFHDQIIAVSSDDRPRTGVACGWQGDLDEVHSGFTTTMLMLAAPTVRSAIEEYGRRIRESFGTSPAQRPTDPAVSGVSYWTDNGAHYYYRGEADLDYPTTIAAAVRRLEDDGLPIHAVQLDSWWYPHEHLRALGELATIVPPSGAERWEPRADALPEGFEGLQRQLGGRPLVLHSRHLMEGSPYLNDGFEGQGDPDLADVWMEQAAQWGACTYEQDWLIEIFLAFPELRRRPGAAAAWQRAMDDAAARRGLTIQWCMPAPADILQTADMSRVSSVRTSMDFRYLEDRQGNWGWFLHVNALARAMRLNTSKDVFVTAGDELAGVESLLAAMSCGPVGIGDPIGATDHDLVLRTCRPDGVIVAPDVAVAAWSHSFLSGPMTSAEPLVGECWSEHPAGRWHYVMAMAAETDVRRPVRVRPADLDDDATDVARVAHQWGTGRVETFGDGGLDLLPGSEGFDLWVVAPVTAGVAVFGDVSRYASAGSRRLGRVTESADGAISLLVYGSPGEAVTITGWREGSGKWQLPVTVGRHGWSRVVL